MNLEDIAKKAGVSRSTVSRVVNGEAYVSPRTRERVMEVIHQEGFSPNPAARALVTQRTQVIGVVIPQSPDVVFEDAYYFPALLQGVSDETENRDYAMLLWMGSGQEENRFHLRVTRNRLMDGLIVASAQDNDPLLARLLDIGTPFVMVERPLHFADRISYVSIDNVMAARTAVEHLLSIGRRRIGTITGNMTISDAVDRLEGYRLALQLSGISYDPSLVVDGYFSRRSGYLGMKALIARKVDAVFAASDGMALGAMDALREANLRVPEDLSVVGFDDLPAAIYSNPALTTIRQPVRRKGARAVALLIDMLEGRTSQPQQILLPAQLVIRQSCGYAST